MTAAKAGIRLLTIPETAERLRCSPKHVYRLIAARVLRPVDIAAPPALKPKTRVREDDLASYISGATRQVPA